jgi:hypothetical protein
MTNMAVALPPQVTQAIAPKYYEKQAAGFCNFLASIGIAPNAEQCIPLQRNYLEAKNAIGKWYTGLSMYYRVLTGGAGATPIVR